MTEKLPLAPRRLFDAISPTSGLDIDVDADIDVDTNIDIDIDTDIDIDWNFTQGVGILAMRTDFDLNTLDRLLRS